METLKKTTPIALIERLQRAMNTHDIEAFLDCFDPDYQSEQPVHPDRAFRGRKQVRKNWTGIFNEIPDFAAQVLHAAVHGDTIWSGCGRAHGPTARALTHVGSSSSAFAMAGLSQDVCTWSRFKR